MFYKVYKTFKLILILVLRKSILCRLQSNVLMVSSFRPGVDWMCNSLRDTSPPETDLGVNRASLITPTNTTSLQAVSIIIEPSERIRPLSVNIPAPIKPAVLLSLMLILQRLMEIKMHPVARSHIVSRLNLWRSLHSKCRFPLSRYVPASRKSCSINLPSIVSVRCRWALLTGTQILRNSMSLILKSHNGIRRTHL